jgi:type VII secretion integral membrane protein EccD
MTAPTGLARVTISAPQRRVDVALPEHVPVAELLPELLTHAGEALADQGQQHGGWVLRRTDGASVQPHQGLHAQNVRDGDVLHLVPAQQDWPELEYDDVVEAIAAGARRTGRTWSPQATKTAAIATAGLALAAGLAARPQWIVAVGVAALLTAAGITAARAYGEGVVGAALAAYAMPYAFAGGAALVTSGAPQLLVGASAVVLAAAIGGVGVAAARRVFVAGLTAGALATVGALLAFWVEPAGAAAIVIALLACGIGAVPLLAVRLGNLPVPPVTLPATEDGLAATRERPASARIEAAIRRTDETLAGLLIGHAVTSAVASVVLSFHGGTAGRLLAGVTGAVLVLRARLFATVWHRVPVLVAGLAILVAPAVPWIGRGGSTAVVTVVVGIALVVILAGTTYAKRPPSPYLARAADLVDMALVVSVVPIACAVLGLYGKMRGLAP